MRSNRESFAPSKENTVEAVNRRKSGGCRRVGLTPSRRRCSRRWSSGARRAPVVPEGINLFPTVQGHRPYGNGMFSTSQSQTHTIGSCKREKQLVMDLGAREKQLEVWRLELSKYREHLYQKRQEASEQMALSSEARRSAGSGAKLRRKVSSEGEAPKL